VPICTTVCRPGMDPLAVLPDTYGREASGRFYKKHVEASQSPSCAHTCFDAWSLPMQKADLARMYRLFSRIPKGLEPVANIFKKHVEGEGTKLVMQVTEALNSKKDKDSGEWNGHKPGCLTCRDLAILCLNLHQGTKALSSKKYKGLRCLIISRPARRMTAEVLSL